MQGRRQAGRRGRHGLLGRRAHGGPLNGWRGRQHCSCQCHLDLRLYRFPNERAHLSDVDFFAFMERRRQFLFLEFKHTGDAEAALRRGADGQLIALQALAGLPGVQVHWVECDGDLPITRRQVLPGGFRSPEPTSCGDFQLFLSAWYRHADAARWLPTRPA